MERDTVTSTARSPVALRLDRSEYAAGANVELTIANQSASMFTFNPCLRIVERQDGGTWSRVEERDRVCTMEGWLLQPSETRSATTDLPRTLAPGRYRLALVLAHEDAATSGQSTTATSAPFSVTR